jgi:hypothetical protein
MNRYPEGYLCIDGAFRIGKLVWGPFHEGVRLRDNLAVVVAHGENIRDPDRAKRRVERNGLATPAYLGFGTIDPLSWRPGPGETEEDADYWGDSPPAGDLVCVEAAPGGVPLAAIRTRLTLPDVIRLGIGLCEYVASAQSSGLVLASIRPETVWLVPEEDSRWRYSGVTPRCFDLVMSSQHPPSAFDLWDSWIPPDADDERYGGDLPSDTDVFATAALLWFASSGGYPFGDPGPDATDYNPEARRPFAGPASLGAVLEPILAYHGADRAPLAELHRGLTQLAEEARTIR